MAKKVDDKGMGNRIFISRPQMEESVFSKTLAAHNLEVYGKSLIEITGVPFDETPEADWIFFYSKNGVKYFFEQLPSLPLRRKVGEGKTKLKNSSPAPPSMGEKITTPKLATIGPGTANYLEENFGHPNFVGDGNAKTTAQSFLKIAAGKKILFPRAKDSRRSVQKWLAGKAELIDLIVYDNVPKKDFDLPGFDILVFTSPLNAKAYFSKNKFNPGQKIIVIGETTATALKELGIKKIIISDNPSEQSLAKTVLQTINK